jgi:hypothetical protein
MYPSNRDVIKLEGFYHWNDKTSVKLKFDEWQYHQTLNTQIVIIFENNGENPGA